MSDVTSKAWRSHPRVTSADVQYLIMAPFAVVAYIKKGNFIHVGVARCNPHDKFNEDQGIDRAAARAKLQYAARLGLIPERRLRAWARRNEATNNPMMLTLTQREFKAKFGTTP